jgi:hypothetical protein
VKRALVALAVVACAKKSDAPKFYLDGGPAPVKADAAPAPADAPTAPAPKPTQVKVAAGDTIACALMSDEGVQCWQGSTPPVDEKLRGVKDIVASHGFSCALLDDTSVTCWGDIGFGAAAKTPKPAGVPGVTKAVRIFAVAGAGCAAIADGAFVCWGDVDERGRVTGTSAHRSPTAVAGVDHVVALAERAALRDDGDLVYWTSGAAKRAQITDGKEVASTGDTACVLRDGGKTWCIAPQPICAKPKPAAPPPKKPAKGKPAKKPPPPPPEPQPTLEELPLPKGQHLALDSGELCVAVDAHKLACVDRANACRVTAKAAKPAQNTIR